MRIRTRLALLAPLALSFPGVGLAQSVKPLPSALSIDEVPRVADPKLPGGEIAMTISDPILGRETRARIDLLDRHDVVTTIWRGTLRGNQPPTNVVWDGRDGNGDFVNTGEYTLRLTSLDGARARSTSTPLSIVRLGITEVEANDSPGNDDEWQMVYFRKAGSYRFYSTPAIHEYLNVARPGEVSDLDLDDGEPRPAEPPYTVTHRPKLIGSNYDTEQYNYPLAYKAGSTTRWEATLGTTSTTSSGELQGVGYPIEGVELRLVMSSNGVPCGESSAIAPGDELVFDGPTLTNQVALTELDFDWTWQYREDGGPWVAVPGAFTTQHRVYTTFDAPIWGDGYRGTRHDGPWVEVADYEAQWAATLGIDTSTSEGLVESHIKGFFGQNGGIPTALEGIVYDCPSEGGDGGATHYHDTFANVMGLSRLLYFHANGRHVNCTDNMGAATTMLAMMGIPNMRPVRLGSMNLRAIWGIGTPGYTLDLWSGSHGFSYHHIVTRDDGVHVSDHCMMLDEDGDPDTLPGTPGWNHDRIWSGPGGYNNLSSTNNVSKSLESLPGIE